MLQQLVQRAAQDWPDRLAVCGPDRSLRYRELNALADAFAHELRLLGVQPGDRVGLLAPKSAAVVAAMQAVLRCGAAYVPLDPSAPLARIQHILRDCDCRAVATLPARHQELDPELPLLSLAPETVEQAIAAPHRSEPGDPRAPQDPSALAYILYTSGSTGTPKGVCLSHTNALAFVQWAKDHLALAPADRLANHAPFHFDLSVLDLYGSFAAGASVHVLDEAAAYAPTRLVDFVQHHEISVWYSVPSALMLMVGEGGLLRRKLPHLRTVVFAGEPYPVRQLEVLQRGLPGVSLHNFYGPTETNVCTAYEVPPPSDDSPTSVPIGVAASGDELDVLGPDGAPVPEGIAGELWVRGPTVMMGYWGQAPQRGAYATGDVVVRGADGNLRFLGRIDHQVKVRGHRIELLEVEAVLQDDPRLKEVCVVVEGAGMQARLTAYAVAEGRPPSLIALKRVCAQRLPKYMIVDAVHYLPSLPRTANGKVDRRALATTRGAEEHA